MKHKRKGPKSTRAGCLLCKPHKHQAEDRRTPQERKAPTADEWDDTSDLCWPNDCPRCGPEGRQLADVQESWDLCGRCRHLFALTCLSGDGWELGLCDTTRDEVLEHVWSCG